MTKIKGLTPLNKIDPKATYLLLISPKEIPHLAIVQNNSYYSLTHRKSVVGEPFRPYLSFLKRAKRQMIFIEINDAPTNLTKVFDSFLKVDTQQITCLMPVKKCLSPASAADFVFELIPELYALGKVKAAYFINMEREINNNGEFHLSEYDKEAIFDYIQSLNEKHVKRQESIS